MQRQSVIIWLFLSLMIAGCSPSHAPEIIEFSGRTMGTWYSVKVAGLPQAVSTQTVADTIERELKNVNSKMSTYVPESELSRFNQSANNSAFNFSKDTYSVITKALEIWRLSHGAFDITVGPLVNLWGFGPDKKIQQVPSKTAMAAAWERVGSDSLQLNADNYSVEKTKDVYVDLSAIAKGYAVDRVAGALQDLGVLRFLVEVGGEIRAGAAKAEQTPWKVALEEPLANQRKVHKVIPLTNLAMATSGDYRNYFEAEGRRYSHTIDPRTGMPISHNLISVSVIMETCAEADAWATAFMVLGPEAGLALAESNKIAVYMIVKSKEGFEARYSRPFTMYLPSEKE